MFEPSFLTRAESKIFGPGPRISLTLVSLESEIGKGSSASRELSTYPNSLEGLLPDQILTWTPQPVRITHRESLASPNIFIDPQPFPRRFLGTFRSMTRIICNQGTRNETSQLLS